MSTLAIWLFIGVVLLFVLAVLGIIAAARSTYLKGKILAKELDGLSDELERTVGSIEHPDDRSN